VSEQNGNSMTVKKKLIEVALPLDGHSAGVAAPSCAAMTASSDAPSALRS